MDNNSKFIMEYDFYGGLLTQRQQEVVKLYHEENLSLSEIAEEFGISRQGVHDTLKNAEAQLAKYEEKLGLVNRFEETGKGIGQIEEMIDALMENRDADKELKKQLKEIKDIIGNINN